MNRLRLVEDTAVVTAASDYEPLNKLPDLEVELRKIEFKGTVVFDLLYFNGLSDNRFVEIMFDGSKFNRASYEVNNNVSTTIKNYQDLFFSSVPTILASSVLSSSEIKNFTVNISS